MPTQKLSNRKKEKKVINILRFVQQRVAPTNHLIGTPKEEEQVLEQSNNQSNKLIN